MAEELAFLALAFPYMAFMLMPGMENWEGFDEYAGVLLPVAFYAGTTVWATVSAYRLKLKQYYLKGACDACITFWGCLFFWIYFFPSFVRNRKLVMAGEADRRVEGGPRGAGCGAYFTALSWWMVWCVIMAVQIPCMVSSPVRAFEASAVALLKKYGEAQIHFQAMDRATLEKDTPYPTGYCDNFRYLYYGKDAEGKLLELIPERAANAFAGPTRGKPLRGGVTDKPGVYRGYVFLEDPYVAENGLWESQFGLVAYPKNFRSGTNVFWLGTDGILLYRYATVDGLNLLKVEESPLHPDGRKLWEEF